LSRCLESKSTQVLHNSGCGNQALESLQSTQHILLFVLDHLYHLIDLCFFTRLQLPLRYRKLLSPLRQIEFSDAYHVHTWLYMMWPPFPAMSTPPTLPELASPHYLWLPLPPTVTTLEILAHFIEHVYNICQLVVQNVPETL
jgi:hypothetical protein